MTTTASKPALRLREKLTQLQHFLSNAKPDLVRLPQFKNLVTNGGFDSNTAWTANQTSTIADGVMHVEDGGLTENIYNVGGDLQDHNLAYLYGFSVLNSTANFGVQPFAYSLAGGAKGTSGDYFTTDGDYTYPLPVGFSTEAFVTGFRRIGSHTGTLDLDNVYLWEVDPSDGAPWLRLPYGFKVNDRAGKVFRDGLLLGLDAYEEITILGQTWIKPLTAPGFNTTFDIWAGL